MGRGGWQVRATSRVAMTSTREHFVIHAAIDAFEGDRRVCCRNWERRIKRELVWRTSLLPKMAAQADA